MKYWVFHEEMLSKALAEHEAARIRDGATEQQAKDDTATVLAFLAGEAARRCDLINDDGTQR